MEKFRRPEHKINPLLFLFYEGIYRFHGSLLEVVSHGKSGVYDLDKNKEIVPTEYNTLRVENNRIIAVNSFGTKEYIWK